MWLDTLFRTLERVIIAISRVVNRVGVSILMVMMFLVTTDVLLRYVFNQPIKSVYEIVEIMLVIVVCFGMAYTAVQKSLVAVEVLVERFPPRVQALIDILNSFLGLGLFSLISWKSAEQAMIYWTEGATTYVSELPIFPFLFVVVFGSVLLSLVLLVNFLESVSRVMKK